MSSLTFAAHGTLLSLELRSQNKDNLTVISL